MASQKTFDIKLGSFTASYRLWETTAPADYDGFGTISLHHNSEIRWVLIRVEHEDWQTMRYRSGMYGAVQAQDIADAEERWVTERLYGRLMGKQEGH